MTTTTQGKPTVLDRLLDAGISEDRARAHLADGWVLVDGEVVTDPAAPAARPASVDLRHRRYDDPE